MFKEKRQQAAEGQPDKPAAGRKWRHLRRGPGGRWSGPRDDRRIRGDERRVRCRFLRSLLKTVQNRSDRLGIIFKLLQPGIRGIDLLRQLLDGLLDGLLPGSRSFNHLRYCGMASADFTVDLGSQVSKGSPDVLKPRVEITMVCAEVCLTFNQLCFLSPQ
jgi:hypothetical protein